MSLTDIHAAAALVLAGAAAAVVGAAAGGQLVERGLAHLQVSPPRRARRLGRIACAVGGLAAVLAAGHVGSWWPLPALLVWAYGLTAAATCDALTQRIPTPLVRRATLVTTVLVVTASAATRHWQWAGLAAISATVAGLIFAVCWRFLGAGFGDVRLAVLGGIGLAHPTRLGLLAGLAAFILITTSQAVVTLARGGNRQTMFPYGPAIVTAMIVAAIA